MSCRRCILYPWKYSPNKLCYQCEKKKSGNECCVQCGKKVYGDDFDFKTVPGVSNAWLHYSCDYSYRKSLGICTFFDCRDLSIDGEFCYFHKRLLIG